MENLDLKDRKILYQLDLNCRQSNTQIGKKVGLSKQVVDSRIKRMEQEGIITGYWTDINTFKLGYQVFRIYITFQYVSTEIKNEIIKYFCSLKDIWVVASVKGEVDLDVIFWVKDNYKFYRFWVKTLDLYEDYFSKATISIYIQAVEYGKFYLLYDEKKPGQELYELTCSGEKIEIDDIDYNLLNEIAVNARIPLIDLAKKLDCSSQTVTYRLKKLQEQGIILAFRLALDYQKIGLQHFKLEIFLKEHRKRKAIINYFKEKPYFAVLNVAIGWCDIECEFVLENVDRLLQVMEKLNTKFPDAIKKQSFWVIEKIHKERNIPEMEFK